MTSSPARTTSDSVRSVIRDYLVREAPISAALTDTARTEVFGQTFQPGALLIGEEFGGAGGSLADALDVVAEAGGALLGASVLAGILTSYALNLLPSNPERDLVLREIAADRIRLAAPIWLSDAGRQAAGLLMLADSTSTHALVFAGAGESGQLVIADLADPAVTAQPLGGIDPTRPLWRLQLPVDDPAVRVLAAGIEAAQIQQQYRRFGRVAIAAEQGAGAQRCVELSVDYAMARTQFGVPIAAFQAVKHACATMQVDRAEAQALTDVAVAAIVGDDPDAPRLAAAAKAVMSEAFTAVARSAIEVHGGVGFAWEHPVQLFYKRALATSAYFGTAIENFLETAAS
jgi:alkylation response protein AidB-like acyl-CoA dehydrogenase